jgi:DNA-binding LacI/PurR family transcriptional regulator
MLKKAPTLRDVAELAGVSRTAVSAVINDSQSTIRISDTTRQRIRAALQQLNFQPDAVARSLRRQRADAIGFFNGFGYIDAMDPFTQQIILGLQSAAAGLSHHVLLYNGLHLQSDVVVRQKLISNKADGIVVWPSVADAGLIRWLGEKHQPVIQLAEHYPGVPAVTADDAAGGRALAEHIADRGHRKVLYRRGIEGVTADAARYTAFESVAKARGIEIVQTAPADRADALSSEERHIIRDRANSGAVSAVVCWHDGSALRALQFCQEDGIRVPRDIAIAGFDGLPLRECPPEFEITTIDVDWQRVAATCVEQLVELIEHRPVPSRTLVPAELRVGNTT